MAKKTDKKTPNKPIKLDEKIKNENFELKFVVIKGNSADFESVKVYGNNETEALKNATAKMNKEFAGLKFTYTGEIKKLNEE